MENQNHYRVIVHLYVFIDVVFRPEDRELIIETLDYPDTYFVKWFMHVYCPVQQDPVGKISKDSKFSSFFLFIFLIRDHRRVPLPLCINGLFYLYRYGKGTHSIFVFVLQLSILLFIAEQSNLVARKAHNLEVTGSNPVSATSFFILYFIQKFEVCLC